MQNDNESDGYIDSNSCKELIHTSVPNTSGQLGCKTTTFVSQFSSRVLNYHIFPSTPAHFMLIITPIVADILKVVYRHIDKETNMNCKLSDLFTEYFKIVLLHRFHRIQVLNNSFVVDAKSNHNF